MLLLTPRGPAGGAPIPAVRIASATATIGRASGADLMLPDPRNMVSSQHCRIERQAGGYLLTDTSTNGTLVNGHRLAAPHRLAEGDVLGIGPWQVAVSLASSGVGSTVPAPRQTEPVHDSWNRVQPTLQQPVAVPGAGGDAVAQLLQAAGMPRSAVAASDAAVLAAAGALLRQFGGGLMAMRAAREQARTELGVTPQAVSSNPLKRQAKPEMALAQLLAAPAAAEQAVAEVFAELDAHQRATLKAMQGALRATLDELAPAAIRAHRPQAGDAALWQLYEKAFAGRGGDASFIEVFARELAAAYTALAAPAGR